MIPVAQTPLNTELDPPDVSVPQGGGAPTKVIRAEDLKLIANRLEMLFNSYRWDRRIAELRWMRNQRQYLGVYDPEVEYQLSESRSKAYPRITRVKCITVLAKLMHLMFPGNERNWALEPAPDPSITPDDVKEAIQKQQERDQVEGVSQAVTPEYAMDAVHQLMLDRAQKLSLVIDDQLQELGGDQTEDYVALNRRVLRSGIQYGLGVLVGPFVREGKTVQWEMDDEAGVPMPKSVKVYLPQFEFLRIWDFYPDLSASTFAAGDGYFVRRIMSKSDVLALRKRKDFFGDVIERYLASHPVGNYKQLEFELELRVMGVRANVNEQKPDTQKYELRSWHGKIDGSSLAQCGVDVPEDKLHEEIDAEIWVLDGNVICAKMNPWVKLGVDVKTVHTFMYDEDDTSPIGFGLPNAMRDSQMIVSAATRMLLDNASVTCGPNLELNTDLLRLDQDLTSLRSYKMWYREGTGPEAQFPAVRNIQIDAHMPDLLKIVELGLKFADSETFVGPADGGDQSQMPSEPYRTASGASMLKGDAALPFKDMVRAYDSFTQSVISSILAFNKVFNPNEAHVADYNVVPRGATSLIQKEVRGMQADQLVTTLTPEEKLHVDQRKLLQVRLRSRDMDDILVTPSEAARRQTAQDQDQAKKDQQTDEMMQAQIRKVLAASFKDIAGGQKNIAAGDAQSIQSVLDLLERGVQLGAPAPAQPTASDPNAPPGGDGAAQAPGQVQGQPGNAGPPAAPGAPA
jgi:hypothetical protein